MLNITLVGKIKMVCDPNFRIPSLCARWPGSTNDSRVWMSSTLCHQFETGKRSKSVNTSTCIDYHLSTKLVLRFIYVRSYTFKSITPGDT